ncbi:SDR family NAD(P)-dependent oxidoreductase [Dechloromonas sp. ZY10]|uniref:SDR family NAD(P)-dependent oxidoreductase n=1 Tax=Dechloromonas aquae TaxID=2664436 RepID=UPI003526EB6A
MQIKDKVFLVTGAGSGLGAATARMLVEAGARVVLADLNREAGDKLAGELGGEACFVETDVASETSAVNAVQTAVARFGALHGLVSCAGIAPAEKVVGKEGPHRLESFATVININLVGTFNMLRLAAAEMQKNIPDASGERGLIINTASIAAFEGQLGQAAKMVPFPVRMGKPAEYASLVRHIAENAYINGEVIRLDGAIRMGSK